MNMPTTSNDISTQDRVVHIRNLIQEARTLAAEQVEALEVALAEVGLLAGQVVEGGDIYPPGLREIARRLAEDAPWACQTLGVIRKRTLEGNPAPEVNLRPVESRAFPDDEAEIHDLEDPGAPEPFAAAS